MGRVSARNLRAESPIGGAEKDGTPGQPDPVGGAEGSPTGIHPKHEKISELLPKLFL